MKMKHIPTSQKPALALRQAVLVLAVLTCCTACIRQQEQPAPEVQSGAPQEIIITYNRIPAEPRDHFGGAVAIEGDVLAAGAPVFGYYPGAGAGSTYVYRRLAGGAWQLEAELTASDRDDGFQFDQHFGEAVALNGRWLAVGAPGSDDRQAGDNGGAVYIFEFDGSAWKESAILKPGMRSLGDRLGTVVAFQGDILATSGSSMADRVITFRREGVTWQELEPLEVAASEDGNPVNVLIDLYGETLAVSQVSWPEPEPGQNEEPDPATRTRQGIVILYELQGRAWKKVFETRQQEASLFRMWDESPFGLPVTLGGSGGQADLLAIGKPGYPESLREQGSVLIYELTGGKWQPEVELVLSSSERDPGALPFFGDDPGAVFFGANVELAGGRLVVVSTFANAVYVFERRASGWVFRSRLTPGSECGDDFMRRVTATDGNSLVLGSPGELGGGSVLEFILDP